MASKKRFHTEKGAWFLAAVSVVLLVLSGVLFVRSRRFLATAERAEGTVVALAAENNHRSNPTYFPVFTFQDLHEHEHKVRSNAGSFPPDYWVGEKVTVLYDADSPDKAELDGFFELWGIPVMLGAVGVVLMVIAAPLIIALDLETPFAVTIVAAWWTA